VILKGTVKDQKGKPVENTRIEIKSAKIGGFKRETFTKKNGSWSIPFIPTGYWRIIAYTPERISSPVFIKIINSNHNSLLTLSRKSLQDLLETKESHEVDISAIGIHDNIELILDSTSTQMLIETKKNIYKKDYPRAIKLLNNFSIYFPASINLENSIYWLAYTLNKYSDTIANRDKKIETYKEGLKQLNNLIKKFPDGEWVDDAKIMRIEFAQKLIHQGLNKYKSIVFEALDTNIQSDIDIKITACDVLISFEKSKAIEYLSEMIRVNKDPHVRKKAIFVLGRIKSNNITQLLKKVAKDDPDQNVRSTATLILNQQNDK
jgi:tetratricopeptide (TPR) repeat protein